jgi:hypothetical protein
METLVGINKYPSWRLDYIFSAIGVENYNFDIYTVIGEKVYRFEFSSPPLNISEMLPIYQKMINSFQLTSK